METNKTIYNLVRVWNNNTAEYDYQLRNGLIVIAYGDYEWAQRTSDHYKITIEDDVWNGAVR